MSETVECAECSGSGSVDSGGFDQYGIAIEMCCHWCAGTGEIKLRDAESQEHFDDSFSTKGMSGMECMRKADDLLVECRKEAAKTAAEWLIKHGYFNGEMQNAIYCYDDGTCNVQVTLSCYGLPNRSEG